jgi:tetratricopeptide (TPR) repeat protein
MVALASLLPAVALVAYYRKSLASDRPTALKLGVLANLVVSVVILWLGFGTKDLGAATTRVVVEDEDGNSVERVVPKSEFRKRLALYSFDDVTDDSATAWLQFGIPLAVQIDLGQDLFVQVTGTEIMAEELRRAGYPSGTDIPLTLMRQIADRHNLPFFVAGSFEGGDGEVGVTVRLYETRRGKLLSEQVYSGANLFSVADEISLALKHDLGIPTQHIEQVEDLPIADRLTSSQTAYRDMVQAYRALTVDQDWPAASAAILRSVEADPANAYAHSLRYGISVFANDQTGASQALEEAMRHIYKLPERSQYATKFQYYDYKGEAEKATAVLRMWIDILPDDVQGRATYATVLTYRDRRAEAIEQYERILEIDPSQTEYLRTLGNLTESMGDFDRATEFYERLVAESPDNYESYLDLGQLQRLQGKFDEAKATLERALVVDPENVAVLTSLAVLERRFGNLDAEVAGLLAALEKARTAQDSVSVYRALANAFEYRGQIQQALGYRTRALTLATTYSPPIAVLRSRLELLDDYISVGQEATAREILAATEQELQPPFDQIAAFGHLNIALELEDPDGVDAAADQIQEFIDTFGVQVLQGPVSHAHARALEMRQQYADAIEVYEQELDKNPSNISINRDVGRCHRKLGDFDAAESSLERTLQALPYSALTHYQMALVHEARGDVATAVRHLETAMNVWADADSLYKPAAEAKEKLAELRAP